LARLAYNRVTVEGDVVLPEQARCSPGEGWGDASISVATGTAVQDAKRVSPDRTTHGPAWI